MITQICNAPSLVDNAFCHSGKLKGIVTGVAPPLLLTLWQNLFMPQLVYRGAQVSPMNTFAGV